MVVYKNKGSYAFLNYLEFSLLCYSLALHLLSDLLRITICFISRNGSNFIKISVRSGRKIVAWDIVSYTHTSIWVACNLVSLPPSMSVSCSTKVGLSRRIILDLPTGLFDFYLVIAEVLFHAVLERTCSNNDHRSFLSLHWVFYPVS